MQLARAERMQDAGIQAVTETEQSAGADRPWVGRAVDALGEGWAVVDDAGRFADVAGALFTMLDTPRPHAQPGVRLREAVRALRSDAALRWPPRGPADGWRWSARRQDGRELTLEAHALDGETWLLRARWTEPAPAREPEPSAGLGLYHPATRLPQLPLLFDRLQQAVERSQRTVTHRFAVILVAIDAGLVLGDRALLKALARALEEAVRPADTVAHLDADILAVIIEPVRGDDATAQVVLDGVVANLRAALDLIPADAPTGAAACFAVALGDGGSHPSDLIALARSRLVRRAPAAGTVTLVPEIGLRDRLPVARVARAAELSDGAALAEALVAQLTGDTDGEALPLVLVVERLPAIEPLLALNLALARRLPSLELTIEIDEAAVARDPEAAIQLADAATARGISVGLAGYGGGRCAEALIARLPLQRLCFDPELTAEARHAAPARVRLAAAIAAARERGLHVVAAEVADPAHATLLASLGCDAARGPLFAEA
jgi:GGDEF domain-containing protein